MCSETKFYTSHDGIRNLRKHTTSKKHIASLKLKTEQTRLPEISVRDKSQKQKCHFDLIDTIISENIPLDKIKSSVFKNFIEKLYSLTHYHTIILEQVYNLKMVEIKTDIKLSNAIYLIFDETTDSWVIYVLMFYWDLAL